VLRADNLTAFLKSGSFNLLEFSGPIQAFTGLALPLRVCDWPLILEFPSFRVRLWSALSCFYVCASLCPSLSTVTLGQGILSLA